MDSIHAKAFHAAPVGNVILERMGPGVFYLRDVNRAAREDAALRRFPLEDVMDKNIADVFPVVRDLGLLDTYEQVLVRQEPVDLGEFVYPNPELSQAVFRVRLIPLDETTLLIFFENVTQRVEAAKRLEARTKELERTATRLKAANENLQGALTRISALEEILSMCMYCGRIRDEDNEWRELHEYITSHTGSQFSHGVCSECGEKQLSG